MNKLTIAPKLQSVILVTCCLLLCVGTPVLAQRNAVEAKHGVVTSAHVLASEAGLEILKKGGNAVDAAIATGFALEVVYPFAGNLGGGGFMMIHTANGKDTGVDYREKAPSASSRDMYLGKDGKPTKGAGSSTVGWRASGVPGSVAGFALAFEKYGSGKVTWAEIIEPSRRLAANGHRVSQATANAFHRMHTDQLLGQFPESKHIYLKDGAFLKAGENWIQSDLAATLERIQKQGPREFYEGQTAHLIADAMAKNGGTISLEDLKAYQAVERVPLRGTYRGYEVVTMPPPSSGGIAILQMLQMLEKYDVTKMGANSSAKDHLFIEVMRRAFRDRAAYLGDPDYVKVPVVGLLDTHYVQSLMANYDPNHASMSKGFKAGKPAGWEAVPVTPAGHESNETTQFTVVDAAGAAVSNTYTLNGGFGSGVTIPGTGLLMNNEMDDFAAQPGTPNMFGLIQGEANAIAPGKRPLSSMTPTFVFKDSKLFLATGSPGGPTIINTVLEVITNVIDHGMPVQQAVEAPRFHHQWMPDLITFERYGLSPDTEKILAAMGHKITAHANFEGAYQGDGESVMIDPKTHLILGAADPRKDDSKAVGY